MGAQSAEVDRQTPLVYPSVMVISIEVTHNSSFCPGVDRALAITEKTLAGREGPTYSVGPLIHNPEVVSRLEILGLEVIDPESGEPPDLEGVPVVIRSHGIDTATEEGLRGRGAVVVDATCPTVKKAQEAARELLDAGYRVLVLGKASHPEVRSIAGRSGGATTVVGGPGEARAWVSGEGGGADRVGIVCQTTIDRAILDSVVQTLLPLVDELEVRDTICGDVTRRREEASEMSGRMDLMIVVGGRNSSNTASLAAICEAAGARTCLVESGRDIGPEILAGVEKVGVAGGASTPDWLISEVVERLEELGD